MYRKYITQILIKTFGGDMSLFLFYFSVFFVHDTDVNYVIITWTMWAGEWRVWKLDCSGLAGSMLWVFLVF
jgi:hypothetical protein